MITWFKDWWWRTFVRRYHCGSTQCFESGHCDHKEPSQ